MFQAAAPVTTGGLWFCDVVYEGVVYCQAMNCRTEADALRRASVIAACLNMGDKWSEAGICDGN